MIPAAGRVGRHEETIVEILIRRRSGGSGGGGEHGNGWVTNLSECMVLPRASISTCKHQRSNGEGGP